MAKIDFEIEGMSELVGLIKELGDLPQKVVTQSAKDGGKIALAAAKVYASTRMRERSGNLARGIVLIGERKSVQAKKVYQVVMDSKMNDVFVKISKSGKRYYYPASMEYGFITKKGTKTAGKHFLRDALVDNSEEIERAVLDKLIKGIDKELSKK